jgi:hypothetical protein
METIKDFLKEFKDRLTSPLFGSFIFAWIIINWRVPIALLFYKQNEMLLDRHRSFIGMIEDYYHVGKFFLFPLIVALFYTFGYPWVRNWIKEYLAQLNRDSDAKILKISKDGWVSVSKHMELQTKYEDNIKKVTDFFEQQDSYSQNLLNLTEENALQKQEISKLKGQMSSSSPNASSSNFHNFVATGKWSFLFSTNSEFYGERKVSFDQSNIYIQTDVHGDKLSHILPSGTYPILRFAAGSRTNNAIFILQVNFNNTQLTLSIDNIGYNECSGILGPDISFKASRLSF